MTTKLIPKSLENRAAIRTACCLVISCQIAFFLHLQNPYWAGMSVVFVSQRYMGESLNKGILRIMGTIVGVSLGYLLAGLVVNSFLLYLVSCFALTFMGFYFFHQSKYPYAFLLAVIGAMLVIAEVALNPNLPFITAIWRSTEITLGVAIISIGAVIILPNHAKKDMRKLVESLNTTVVGILSASEFEPLLLKAKTTLSDLEDLLNAMKFEVSKSELKKLQNKIKHYRNLIRQLHLLKRLQCDHEAQWKHYCIHLNEALLKDLKSLADTEKNPNNSISLTLFEAIEQEKSKALKETKNDPRFYLFIDHYLALFDTLSQIMATQSLDKLVFIAKEQRLKYDVDVIKQAIKASITLTLAIIMWLYSQWPGGIQGIISGAFLWLYEKMSG